MNNEEWGVTERGFHRPTYVELLNAIEYKARELFGDRANLTVRSPWGFSSGCSPGYSISCFP